MINLTPELAEICGIHAGDGYLRNDGRRVELDISGNVEETDYYDNHVIALFKKSFGFEPKPRLFVSRNTYGFVVRDKEVVKNLHDLGFPYGNKSLTVRAPLVIMQSNDPEIYCRFLRGLFDTDGCISFRNRKSLEGYTQFKRKYPYYPAITFGGVSKGLMLDVRALLNRIGIKKTTFYFYKSKKITENDKHRIIFYGPQKIEEFFRLVGSKNLSKFSRYLVWKKCGFCPTRTTYHQRKGILKDEINPYSLVDP